MKQLLLGLVLGILCSSVIFFIIEKNSNQNFFEKETNGIVLSPGKEDIPIIEPKPIFWEDHSIATKYIHDNLTKISDSSASMRLFIQGSPYSFAAALYAVKNNNIQLWREYWLSLYDLLETPPFDRVLYQEQINNSFQDIQNNSLRTSDYKEYLLDGAVYFSLDSLDDKLSSLCVDAFHEEGGDIPEDGVDYCKSIAHIHEAIRTEDVSYCSKISYIPEGTALVENCEALFNSK